MVRHISSGMCVLIAIMPQVIRDKLTNVSRGFAFVSYTHAQAAHEAMAQVDRKPMYGPFEGRQVKVAPSSKRQQMQQR